MWDCGPYADLYEELDYLEHETVDEYLRQPMEFAANNVRAFMSDIESATSARATFKFEFGKPVRRRFKFDLTVHPYRGYSDTELTVHKFVLWMPSERLCEVREMPATKGRRNTLLLDGEDLFWEDAVKIIEGRVQEGRLARTSH